MLVITRYPRRFITSSKRILNVTKVKQCSNVLLDSTKFKKSFSSCAVGSLVLKDTDDLVGERLDNWYTSDRNVVLRNVPGQLEDGTLTCLGLPDLKRVSRQEVLDYLDNTWSLTDVLLSSLQGAESFLNPPYHQLRHPMAFYYGHPTVFYVNKLRLSGVLKKGIHEEFEEMFEVGVDEMNWDDMSKNECVWPSMESVRAYRREVYKTLKGIVETHEELRENHNVIDEDSALWALFMGFEHDHIHLETSSVLMRELPLGYLKRPKYWPNYYALKKEILVPVKGVDYPDNYFVKSKGGVVKIGKSKMENTFGWDNEYGEKRMEVKPFKGTAFMVSNAEFLEFVKGGGYHENRYWSEEGWKWKCFRNTKWPTFWEKFGPSGLNRYKLRLIFDVVDMQWDWPVEVNHHEAQAYCKWKAEMDKVPLYHLTTETIHHVMRNEKMDKVKMVNGDKMADLFQKNLNLSYSSASPVDAFPCNENGFYDTMGNAWELAQDAFSPLPGFKVHPIYEDFSTPCFDGEHQMILGGSFASCGDNGASIYSRYHFRRHFFQHSGFRLIQPEFTNPDEIQTTCMDAPGPYAKPNPYRTSATKSNVENTSEQAQSSSLSLASHFGHTMPFSALFYQFNSPQRLANFAKDAYAAFGRKPSKESRIIDLGCGAGGISFHLGNAFQSVLGIDHDIHCIDMANALKSNRQVSTNFNSELFKATLDPVLNTNNVQFEQRDVCASEIENADGIVVYNLLEELDDPQSFLTQLGKHTNGLLILGTTFNDKIKDTQQLESILSSQFKLVQQEQTPIFYRDSIHSCRIPMVHLSAWQKI